MKSRLTCHIKGKFKLLSSNVMCCSHKLPPHTIDRLWLYHTTTSVWPLHLYYSSKTVPLRVFFSDIMLFIWQAKVKPRPPNGIQWWDLDLYLALRNVPIICILPAMWTDQEQIEINLLTKASGAREMYQGDILILWADLGCIYPLHYT